MLTSSHQAPSKPAGALDALAAAGKAMIAAETRFKNVTPIHEDEPEKLVWSQCNANCGSRCVFWRHAKDGKIQRLTTDDTGGDNFQARACLRGRAMRQWVNSPTRFTIR